MFDRSELTSRPHDGLDLSSKVRPILECDVHWPSRTRIVRLCSAPCKALRFASTALARGVGLDGASAQPVVCRYVMAGRKRSDPGTESAACSPLTRSSRGGILSV